MSSPKEANRWAVLALLSAAQLMVVLDASIVNIALPSAQRALHFSSSDRQWIVTAYALAFGSLLLLGGKLGDIYGRKWTFIVGLCGFSIVSAVGGLSTSYEMLVVCRALQGAFAAMLAPSALGLLTSTFADRPERPTAFGIFGAIAGGGASIGLLLGGVLTQILSWRWCLYVNPVIAVPTAIFGFRLLVNQSDSVKQRIDVWGLITGSVGLFALVYGFSNVQEHSWTATTTLVALIAAVVLLSSFVVVESRVKNPLLPLHIVWDRARGGAYLAVLLGSAAVFGVFFFLTYYLQQTLGFSPLVTGLAFLPMTGVLIVTSLVAQTQLVPRFGAKPLVVSGMTLGAIGMLLLTRLTPDSSYASGVLPGLLIIGLGMGCIFAPAMGTATLGVELHETGVASALVNMGQQVGGSVGLAFLSAMSAGATASYLTSHRDVKGVASLATVHGYTTAFEYSAAIFGLGLALALIVIPRKDGAPVSLKDALARGIAYAHHTATPTAAPPPAA